EIRHQGVSRSRVGRWRCAADIFERKDRTLVARQINAGAWVALERKAKEQQRAFPVASCAVARAVHFSFCRDGTSPNSRANALGWNVGNLASTRRRTKRDCLGRPA